MHDDLRDACGRAVDAGTDYLSRTVAPNGGWPAKVYEIRAPLNGSVTHVPPFVAAMGAMSLTACRHPDAASIRERSRSFLREIVEPQELWRYIHFVPPDTDDTSICTLATGPYADALPNEDVIIAQGDPKGRFCTWIFTPDYPVKLFNEPDAVVNANIIAYLGDRPETRAAQDWLRELIAGPADAIDDAIHYYPHQLDLDIALARANHLQAPLFAELRDAITERILASQAADGLFADAMRTGQALTALDRLGALSLAHVVQPAVERLLATQRADGSWPGCLAWQGGPGFPFAFESAALSTASCIEALERVRHGQSG